MTKFVGMLVLMAFLSFASLQSVRADEPAPLPVRALLDAASVQNTHTVMIRGTVRKVKSFPPFMTKLCNAVHGSYEFVLEDGADAIAVEVFGVCGAQSGGDQIFDGQRVQVVGKFLIRSKGNESMPIVYTDIASVSLVQN
ncbi:MAG: conserved exported protein of unknown function [Nitrospira sp.]|nr:MAG: conserved exported protein of unknown function [Nitrospira sp.]